MVRFGLLLIYIILVTVLYWLLYDQVVIGIDDANIYFTYARNFVEGHGFVYYPGGERVEGFTSLLWTLITTLFYFISEEHFRTFILIFSALMTAVALLVCLNFIRRLTRTPLIVSPQEILFLLVLTIIPGYIDWTVMSLMETGLWSFFIIIMVIRLCYGRIQTVADRVILSALLAVLLILRPESMLFNLVFIVLIFFRYLFMFRNPHRAGLKVLPFILVVVVTTGALTLFRVLYFGYPLPNTYYAKVSGDFFYNLVEGVKYFGYNAMQTPLLLIAIAATMASAILLVMELKRIFDPDINGTLSEAVWIQLVLTTVNIVSLLIPLMVGGDHFKLLRFLQPYFPLYWLLFFNLDFWKSFVRIRIGVHPSAYYIVVVLLIPFIYFSTFAPLHTFLKTGSPIQWEFGLAQQGLRDAEMMNKLFSRMGELPSVGVSAAGGFGYAYEGVVYDLMGLNNEKMAHNCEVKTGIKNHAAFDKKVFFELGPDVFHGYFKISGFVDNPGQATLLLLENQPGFEESYVSRMYKRLFEDPEFIKNYKPVIIEDDGIHLKTYARAGFIDELKSYGYNISEIPRNPGEMSSTLSGNIF